MTGNVVLAAITGSLFGKSLHLGRCPMGRQSVHLERDFHLIEELGSLFHHRKVGRTAHDNTYNWFHDLSDFLIELVFYNKIIPAKPQTTPTRVPATTCARLC